MAREIQRLYESRINDEAGRLGKVPNEVRKPEERLARLKERLRRGDPDMEPDELHAAIERAEAKRRELLTPRPAMKESAKLVTLLPRAAELCRQQIEEGLIGVIRALPVSDALDELGNDEVQVAVAVSVSMGGHVQGTPSMRIPKSVPWSRLKPRRKY